ncbi:MAG: endolytic transglycosylase MltG [Rikenellaceae bacterium]
MNYQIDRVKLIRITVVALSIALSIMVFVCNSFFGTAVRKDQVIYLSSRTLAESDYKEVMDSLVMDYITRKKAFKIYAKRLNLDSSIRPGRYHLKKRASVIDVVRMLKIGIEEPLKVTFNNIKTTEQLAGRLSAQLEADSISLLEAFRQEELSSGDKMLSLIIPNTYELYWTTTPEDLIKRMRRESDRFWNTSREEKRKKLGMSRNEVMTLASIVGEESNKTDEMARIAGVYLNRLNRKMRLQSDPTVKYATGDFTLKRILNEHLAIDSPYNTYKYRGLPPSPISMPSIAAIDGVLNSEKHGYLFFCARPSLDGYHDFEVSYDRHLENARRYQAQLNSMNIK